MKLFSRYALYPLVLLLALSCASHAGSTNPPASTNASALVAPAAQKETVVLIIRHAEKGFFGSKLSASGRARADKLATYFTHCEVDGKPVALDHLFATEDSDHSKRPRLTLEPLARATGLSIDDHFKNRQYAKLAEHVRKKCQGGQILISWHHGTIPEFLTALGAEPATLLPGGKWPSKEYNWVIQLRFDKDGRLNYSRCVTQVFE